MSINLNASYILFLFYIELTIKISIKNRPIKNRSIFNYSLIKFFIKKKLIFYSEAENYVILKIKI